MIAVRTIAAVLCLTMAAPVLAEEPKVPKVLTAKGLVDIYMSDREHDLAKAYVHGIIDGFVTAEALVESKAGGHLFCSLEQYPMVEDQLVAVVRQFIEKNQLASDMPFSTVAAFALTQACKKQ